jgi:hypothetical protein
VHGEKPAKAAAAHLPPSAFHKGSAKTLDTPGHAAFAWAGSSKVAAAPTDAAAARPPMRPARGVTTISAAPGMARHASDMEARAKELASQPLALPRMPNGYEDSPSVAEPHFQSQLPADNITVNLTETTPDAARPDSAPGRVPHAEARAEANRPGSAVLGAMLPHDPRPQTQMQRPGSAAPRLSGPVHSLSHMCAQPAAQPLPSGTRPPAAQGTKVCFSTYSWQSLPGHHCCHEALARGATGCKEPFRRFQVSA